MGRKIAKHPVKNGSGDWGHPVLFHHEIDDLLPALPGQALLSNEAFGVADDARGMRLNRTVTCHEDTEIGRFRLTCRHGSRLFRILSDSLMGGNNDNGKHASKKAPDSPTHPPSVGPSRDGSRPLRLHQLVTAAHDTRSATRCIVLLRYPLGFQSMAWGCITPALSVARAHIS